MIQDETTPLVINSESPATAAPMAAGEKSKLLVDNLLLVANCLSVLAYILLGKTTSEVMQNYVFTLAFMQPLLLWPVFFIWFVCKRKSMIPLTMKAFTYLTIGATCIFLSVLGSKYGSRGDLVSGPVGSLVQQFLIVVLMALSVLVLKMRFRVLHYLGALLVVTAVIVVLIPSMLAGLNVNDAAALAVLILQNIPLSISLLINQHLLKSGMSDLATIYFIVVSIHSVLNLLAIPLIPLLQPNLHWWGDIVPNMRNGFLW
jgi:drug/metabolite transporter (DMT)-like permease